MTSSHIYHCHYNNLPLTELQMREAIAIYLAYCQEHGHPVDADADALLSECRRHASAVAHIVYHALLAGFHVT